MRISDWSSDVCSSDLALAASLAAASQPQGVITMNAVLKTETVAIEAAAPLEVADPTKNLILVPLSQLLPRRPKRNVRTTPRQSIPELAATIPRIGLLQNLSVTLSADGEAYEVVAGDRRLTALKLLAKKKRIRSEEHTSELQSLMRIS